MPRIPCFLNASILYTSSHEMPRGSVQHLVQPNLCGGQRRNTGVRMSEATPKPRTKKNAGFNNFLTEHREEIEYRLRREMGAGAKITKRAVNSEARSAWESLDEDERRVYSL